ncbi:hypothetical protein RchiOBHm_Chr6g0275321 [Rosa chinensis]|uniref:Uncharacterized protein n=1 Tax=Rosa chinensis TaxID=74649 RepID=A0A2P6PS16_ROSCH|nr:hypothetical protein RchiOBHm_Chr6g0275321 [Rosa chinensis]
MSPKSSAGNQIVLNFGASMRFCFFFFNKFDVNHCNYCRTQILKQQFAHLYVICTLPTKEQNDLFVRSYFNFGLELGKPAFVLVKDLEMGFEKMLRIVYARGVCKREDVTTKLKAQVGVVSIQTLTIIYVILGFDDIVCTFLSLNILGFLV